MRFTALLCLLLLTGCEAGNMQDLEEFVKQSGADMRGMVDAPREMHPAPSIDFKGTGPQPQPFDPARAGQTRPDAKARRHG